jgi:hypothetical protein
MPAAFSTDGDEHAGIGSGRHALVLLPMIGLVIAMPTMIMMCSCWRPETRSLAVLICIFCND